MQHFYSIYEKKNCMLTGIKEKREGLLLILASLPSGLLCVTSVYFLSFSNILFVSLFLLNIWVVFHCVSHVSFTQLKNKLFPLWQLWTKPLETFANRFSVNINFNFSWSGIPTKCIFNFARNCYFFFWKYLFSLPFPSSVWTFQLSYIFSIICIFFKAILLNMWWYFFLIEFISKF